jgi:hypothetical protein
LKVWDSENGEQLETLKGHKACILDVKYSKNGKYIGNSLKFRRNFSVGIGR